MAAGAEEQPPPPPRRGGAVWGACEGEERFLQKFRLYETRSKFYMIGRNKTRTSWRVLTIDRLEPSELNVHEDVTVYSASECYELLKRINEGNKSTGGLKFVTTCYGIVGFVKFLGPYYMLLITKRKLIGTICSHKIYAISKSKMIAIPNSVTRSNISNHKDEKRYKKLLCTVDLTKDFFFSYSYHVMRSLQKNISDSRKGDFVYETMFVWNEFLTRGIRNRIKSNLWTVALVHGFFKQAKLTACGKEFRLVLIARRSRYYAGTRFLKRGVNEKGRVANDVETEQIVFEETPGECPTQVTSVIQNRGSIPLFWSQETSKLNLKPDIVLHEKDQNYEATKLHFENLVKRYGNPIIILNLIKCKERKPRESKLRVEFANAIDIINKDLSEDGRLRFLHWDLSRHSRSKATSALELLGRVAAYALTLTEFFYFQLTPAPRLDDALRQFLRENGDSESSVVSSDTVMPSETKPLTIFRENGDSESSVVSSDTVLPREAKPLTIFRENGDSESSVVGSDTVMPRESCLNDDNNSRNINLFKPPMFQRGVLRTNCIDCLDRTNVAQYAYGLAALGYQLHALGLIDDPKIDLDDPLADDLMSFYETMGDTLALQYTGSAAHNKIFCERRGHWKAAIQSQEFLRTLQRYYSNAYVDAEKQDAINIFLGYFQPQLGKPAIWEMGSDQHCNIKKQGDILQENSRTSIRRSLSDGNILCEDSTPVSGVKKLTNSELTNVVSEEGGFSGVSGSAPEISTCQSDISYSRCTPMVVGRQLFVEVDHICFNEQRICGLNCSNFLHVDWLSSSGSSCAEEICERSSLTSSPLQGLSTENVVNGLAGDAGDLSEGGSSIRDLNVASTVLQQNTSGISEHFVNWVVNGGTFYL